MGRILIHGICLAAWTVLTTASWDGNINYGSPSLGHAPLGINTEKVKKRMLQKRDGSYHDLSNVTFTHGVASV
jgi:alkaline phosphatase D